MGTRKEVDDMSSAEAAALPMHTAAVQKQHARQSWPPAAGTVGFWEVTRGGGVKILAEMLRAQSCARRRLLAAARCEARRSGAGCAFLQRGAEPSSSSSELVAGRWRLHTTQDGDKLLVGGQAWCSAFPCFSARRAAPAGGTMVAKSQEQVEGAASAEKWALLPHSCRPIRCQYNHLCLTWLSGEGCQNLRRGTVCILSWQICPCLAGRI